MFPTSLSKDVEVELIFSNPRYKSEESGDSDNRITYFIFDEADMWEVKLWQEKNEYDIPIGVPARFFVEFEYPQSLSGKLIPGKEFEIWEGQTVGQGRILQLLDLEKRAQKNIEHIVRRTRGEVEEVLEFNKSLCGEPVFDEIDKIFYQKLKVFLGMEMIEDYLWLWEKPQRLHTLVEFNNPKVIPQISLLLPDNPTPIWFLVDIDLFLSCWFLYEATFIAIENILQKYKFSQYYIVAKDFSWLIRKIDKGFVAIGNDVERKLKQYQIV